MKKSSKHGLSICGKNYKCSIILSGTTIRSTQIVMENHLAYPSKRKDQRKREGLNSPLLGLQQDMWANHPISPLLLRPHSEGSRNTSDSPDASALGSQTQATPDDTTTSPEPQSRQYLSPPRLRPASDAAPPLARSRPSVTSPMFSRLPNRTVKGLDG
jgi:hypothetical protein